MKMYLDQMTLGNSIAAVIDILERIGVRFDNEDVCDLFHRHGAKIDGDIVKIPRKLLEKSIASVPKGEYGKVKNQRVAAATLFSNAPFVVDNTTGRVRRCTVADEMMLFRLNETSSLYETANPGCADPENIGTEDSFVAQIAMTLKYSLKYPSIGLRATGSNSKNGNVYAAARRAFRLVREFYDTWDKPVMTQGICPNSPLAYDHESLDNLNAAIAEKQSIALFPCTVSFMTGPERLMDLVLHDFAMVLAGVCYIGLAAPGLDVSLSDFSASSDIRALQPVYGCAESIRLQVIFYELARYFSIPCSVCGGYGDGINDNDYQAGMETMMTMLQPFRETELDEVWCYPGHLSGFSCGSFRKAILDEEAIRLANRTLQITDTSIRRDLGDLLQTGRENNSFLSLGSMRNYREEQYMTSIFNKKGIAKAMPNGVDSVKETVDSIIEERIASYQAPVLTRNQENLLKPFLPPLCTD